MDRAIRLRPEEYRRLWAAIRADFELDATAGPSGSTIRGYGRSDAFYWATGKFTRAQDLQQLGGRSPADRRREDEPLAALRAGPHLALPEGQRGIG